MAGKGPQKTPTALLASRGSWRAKIRQNEPVYIGKAEKPIWLSALALSHWDSIEPILSSGGAIMSSDSTALALLCESCARYLHYKTMFEEKFKNNPVMLVDGKIVDNPVANRLEKAQDSFLKLLRDFGMTPASRANIEKIPININNSQVAFGNTDKNRFFNG